MSTCRPLPGVLSVSVNPLQARGQVVLDASCSSMNKEKIVQKICSMGFEASILSEQFETSDFVQAGNAFEIDGMEAGKDRTLHLQISIQGMHCSACSTAVEAALRDVPDVIQASVSLPLHQAKATIRSQSVSDERKLIEDKVIEAIENCGFDAKIIDRREETEGEENDSVTLNVYGMTCSSCSCAVEEALRGISGVESASVNLLANNASVSFDPNITGPRDFIRAIEDVGFEAEITTGEQSNLSDRNNAEVLEFRQAALKSAFLTLPVMLVMILTMSGVGSWLRKTLILGFTIEEVIKVVFTTPIQYGIGKRFHVRAYKAIKSGRANMDVLVSLGTNASYIYSVISILHHHLSYHHASGNYIPTDFFETSAMLITLVLFGKYMESSAKGKTSEAIVKLCQLSPPTAIIVTSLENSSRAVTSEKLHAATMANQNDWNVEKHGLFEAEETEIPTALVHRGDILKVLPGARIPADGVVARGSSYVDESMLTGESDHIYKSVGDAVFGGTVNAGSMIHVRATRVGSETVLSQIVRMVETAQLSKAPIQGFADRVSAVFVPVVVSLAILTFIIWFIAGTFELFPLYWLPEGHSVFLFSLMFGIAVIVIACPCALGLATPTAVMVGTGVAAGQGILIKGGEALERAVEIKTVIFDKTGTLTAGKPHVVDYILLKNGISVQTMVGLAAALESTSEHPIAGAIISFYSKFQDGDAESKITHDTSYQTRNLKEVENFSNHEFWKARIPENVDIQVGRGILGKVPVPSNFPGISSLASSLQESKKMLEKHSGKHFTNVDVIVGNARLMEESGIFLSDDGRHYMTEMESRGCTVIMVAASGMLLGMLSVMDPIKPEARGVIASLHHMGLSTIMLTGDNSRTAKAIASQLGIDTVHAEVLPAGKVNVVRSVQEDLGEHTVAMVGDGVNDSPALAQADVGIAVGSGADVAIEAADFVLMKSDLEDVLMAFDICRKTFARIKWNYAWALGYNLTMIPIAAGCLYPRWNLRMPPWIAGACMAASSVSVVMSSLMLRYYKRPRAVLRDVVVVAKPSKIRLNEIELQ